MNLIYIILLRDISHMQNIKKTVFSVLHLQKINDSCVFLATPPILQTLKKQKVLVQLQRVLTIVSLVCPKTLS